MKRFILMVLLCVSTFAISQNSTGNPRTITVQGSAVRSSKNIVYKTNITLSLENNYYADNPCGTIEELEEKYFTELKKQHIDKSKFVKDELAYAGTGYRKNRTMYRFETPSKDEILKVVGIKMGQVQTSYVQVKTLLDQDEIKALTKMALKDARNNANMVAEITGEKLGKIYSISGNYGAYEYWRTPSSDEDYFRLTVVYTLID